MRDLLLSLRLPHWRKPPPIRFPARLGQATARGAYMITDFRDAPIGTNGAVSVEGTISGCVAACIVAWVSAVVGLVDWHWTPVITFAAIRRHVP